MASFVKTLKIIINRFESYGFTLIEMSIVIFLFTIVATVVSIIYINLINSTLIINDYYQSLENVRLGTEKLWRLIKYGWNFNIMNNSISFKNKNCFPIEIVFDPNNRTLNIKEDNFDFSSVFDDNLVKVNNIVFNYDRPLTNQRYFYFQYAPKIIIIYYDLEIKSRRGVTTSLIFQQAVAPLNSTYSRSLCN